MMINLRRNQDQEKPELPLRLPLQLLADEAVHPNLLIKKVMLQRPLTSVGDQPPLKEL
jgi:hypothetical protein